MSSIKQLLKDGVVQQKAGQHVAAVAIYRQILKRQPRNFDAVHLLGLALVELGEVDKGRKMIEKALRAHPGNAVFNHNYASVITQFGDLEAAERHFYRAIKIKPDYAEAYYNLASNIKNDADNPLLGEIANLLENQTWDDRDLCFLHFAAGKLADDIGAHDQAFGHFEAGNKVAGKRFDPAINANFVAELSGTFSASLFENLRGLGHDSRKLVFIVGMPRSGTTLVEQILSSHPDMFGAGERRDLGAISRTLSQHDPDNAAFPLCVPRLPREAFVGYAGSYLANLEQVAGPAARIIDKHPLNFRLLGLIALMFPHARILHCRRNPVDTCLSCYFQYFQSGQEFSFDQEDIAAFYGDYRDLMTHWRATLPLEIMDIDYETLVADQEATSRAMVEFCGLNWDNACLDFQNSRRTVRTASKWQVRQPIYSSSVARWRRYEKHLGPLLAGLSRFQPTSSGSS